MNGTQIEGAREPVEEAWQHPVVSHVAVYGCVLCAHALCRALPMPPRIFLACVSDPDCLAACLLANFLAPYPSE